MNTFKKIASKSLFSTLCLSSLLPRLYEDVWVPGISSTYQSYVSCENKITIDNKTCNSNIADTAACPLSSCLDTFSIVGAYNRASGNINSLIVHSNTRYELTPNFNPIKLHKFIFTTNIISLLYYLDKFKTSSDLHEIHLRFKFIAED